MLSIIFFSLAFAAVASKETLEEITKKRSPFLAQRAQENPESPFAAVGARIKDIGLLGLHTPNENWIIFASAGRDASATLKATGNDKMNWEDFQRETNNFLDKNLPAIGSEAESNPDNLAFNKAYVSRFENIINYYFGAALTYITTRIYDNIAERARDPKYKPVSLDIKANDFFNIIYKRTLEYANKYDSDVFEMKGNTKVLNGAAKAVEALNNYWVEKYQNFIENYFMPAGDAQNFLNSAAVYYEREIKYLVAYAAVAPEDQIPLIVKQIKEAVFVSITLSHNQQPQYTLQNIFNNLAAFFAESTSSEELKVAPKAFGAILDGIQENLGENQAKEFAVTLIGRRTGSRFNIKNIPVGGAEFAASILESNSENGWKGVFALSLRAGKILGDISTIFQTSMLSESQTEFYKVLVKAVFDFAMTAENDIAPENLAQEFNAYLDKHYLKDQFYVILKINGLNMIKNSGFPFNFQGLSDEGLRPVALYINSAEYISFRYAVDQAYSKLTTLEGRYPVEPFGRLTSVNFMIIKSEEKGTPVSSTIFSIVKWGDAQLII